MSKNYHKQIKALVPPRNTDEHRDFLMAAMEVIADEVKEHALGSVGHAQLGLRLLYEFHGHKRIERSVQ